MHIAKCVSVIWTDAICNVQYTKLRKRIKNYKISLQFLRN